jgi:hypothetical protein
MRSDDTNATESNIFTEETRVLFWCILCATQTGKFWFVSMVDNENWARHTKIAFS